MDFMMLGTPNGRLFRSFAACPRREPVFFNNVVKHQEVYDDRVPMINDTESSLSLKRSLRDLTSMLLTRLMTLDVEQASWVACSMS